MNRRSFFAALVNPPSSAEAGSGAMTVRTGGHGERISLLGYGAMRYPTVDGSHANAHRGGSNAPIDTELVQRQIDYCIAHGVNYFDTSPAYCRGESEKVLGDALAKHPRDAWFVATKLSNFNPKTHSFEASREMYETSKRLLRTDHLDFYLLHCIGGGSTQAKALKLFDTRFIDNGMLDFLVKEKEAGRIRNLGWSFHGDVAVFDYMLQLHDEGKYKWDFVQIQMNYLDWTHAKETNPRNVNAEYLYGELAKRNIPCTIMEPLLGGRLSNVPNHIVARLKQQEPENSVASWAFRFCGTFPMVLSVLSGMTYMEHLQDNIRSLAPVVPLSEADLAYLEDTASLMVTYPTIPCNSCQYCMPCPYGLDIPGILVHYNKCVNEGNVPESRQDPNYKKARQAFLVGYDRSVPKLRQASHCTGCNQCSPECPQRINIPQQMQRIDKYVEALKQETL